jgi:hypothetical protein
VRSGSERLERHGRVKRRYFLFALAFAFVALAFGLAAVFFAAAFFGAAFFAFAGIRITSFPLDMGMRVLAMPDLVTGALRT